VLHVSFSSLSLSLSPNIFALFFSPASASRVPGKLFSRVFFFNLSALSTMSQTHLGRDDPKRCNQIKIMPFTWTSLAMSPFLFACWTEGNELPQF
jgi:hypothetical protein